MKKALTKINKLYYYKDGKRIEGAHKDIRGDVSEIRGNVSCICGDVSSYQWRYRRLLRHHRRRQKKRIEISELVGRKL